MPVTDQDARALAYLARRIRQDADAPRWDQAGIDATITKLVGRGLVSSIERVTRHAADPKAQTPGAILRPFVPEATVDGPPQPPRVGEHCHTCGRHLDHCVCGERQARPPRRSEHVTDHAEAIRQQLHQEEA